MSTRTQTLQLAEGLHVLQSTLTLDGHVSAYPPSARGESSANCYLLRHGTQALLIDTGFSTYEDEIVQALTPLISADCNLQLFPLRLNEHMSVGNGLAIARRLGAECCHALVPRAALWLGFADATDDEIEAADALLPTRLVPGSGVLPLGVEGKRDLEILRPPIQLIPNRWLYDSSTRTLFTSDMFGHVWSTHGSDMRGRRHAFVLDETSPDDTTVDHLIAYLLDTRYWWLEGARTDELLTALDATFAARDIQNIAPGWGCVLRGEAVVQRHYKLLRRALVTLDARVRGSSYIEHSRESQKHATAN